MPLLKTLSRRRIRQIEGQLRLVEKKVGRLSAINSRTAERMAILKSIPGISTLTAATLLAEMPELGDLDAKAVGALSGLAPMNRESGLWRGKARIQGGRREVRRAMFMPALVSLRRNPEAKRWYDELKARGKPGKVAVTAIMRKMLIMANALLRDGRQWENAAPIGR